MRVELAVWGDVTPCYVVVKSGRKPTGSSSLFRGFGGQGAAELAAQIHGGIVDVLAAGDGPQIEGVAAGVALEALEGVILQVRRERTALGILGTVDRAGAALLHVLGRVRCEAEQGEDLGQGDRFLDSGEVDAGASAL